MKKKTVEQWIYVAPLLREMISMVTTCTEKDSYILAGAMSVDYPYGIEGVQPVVETAIRLGMIEEPSEKEK